MRALENRIPPALIMAAVGVLMYFVSPILPDIRIERSISLFIGVLITLIGVVFGLFGVYEFVKNNTTVDPTNPEKTSSLVTSGVLKISRNPMYVAMAFFLFGFSFLLSSLLTVFLVSVFFVYMNRFQIEPEERIMSQKFGDEFLRYKENVRRWL